MQIYRKALSSIIGLRFVEEAQNIEYNYGYFPIFIDEETFGKSRDEIYECLKSQNIHGRYYFYPLISELDEYNYNNIGSLTKYPLAYQKSKEVICIPLHPNLQPADITRITGIIKDCL